MIPDICFFDFEALFGLFHVVNEMMVWICTFLLIRPCIQLTINHQACQAHPQTIAYTIGNYSQKSKTFSLFFIKNIYIILTGRKHFDIIQLS